METHNTLDNSEILCYTKQESFVWALDISMSNVGVSIFSNDGTCKHVCSIGTKSGDNHQTKLKYIGKELLKLRKKYSPSKLIVEAGFTRFNLSTQALYKCHGVVAYLFWDVEQIYYQPMTIKKVVGGKGNMKKDEIMGVIMKKYPDMKFDNFDESDSFSVGLCYFYKEGVLK
jgi:Holliday junction resolvasome RuvABC endonuclease subunit